ncbi:MAG: NfeD family protein [Candidatus Gastranaerophilales bacterium]|nr:NfeD family protein [Candidatus Gastranaerophilales bacterium]
MFTMWQVMLIVGLLFLILEIFTPAMFFLNFAISAIITAILALFINNFTFLIVAFVILSIGALTIIRPLLMNIKNNKDTKTGIEEKYIGKTVKVIVPVTKYAGAITIYGERWEARTDEETEIPVDTEVKIIRNESLIMYVEKI